MTSNQRRAVECPVAVGDFAILAHREAAGFGANPILRIDHENARAGITEPLNDVEHFGRAQHDEIEARLAGTR